MPPARKRSSPHAPARRPRAPAAASVAPPSPPTEVERELLALAQRLARWAAEPEPAATSLRAALDTLLAAHAAPGRLARLVVDAWRDGRSDKRAALALAFAREQLRLAVVDLVAREVRADRAHPLLPVDAVSALVLAVADALTHEPPGTVPERVDVLLALAGAGPAR